MEIVTSRLLLREYAESDVHAFLAYQADRRAAEFTGPVDQDPAALRALVPLFRRWRMEAPRRNWQLAIARQETPAVTIGSVGLRTEGEPPGTAQFGLELAPAYWGLGYGPEAARAMLAFGFRELGLDVVRGETVSANDRITRLLTQLCFRHGGDRDAPAWMTSRGWRAVSWELTRGDWIHARPG